MSRDIDVVSIFEQYLHPSIFYFISRCRCQQPGSSGILLCQASGAHQRRYGMGGVVLLAVVVLLVILDAGGGGVCKVADHRC